MKQTDGHVWQCLPLPSGNNSSVAMETTSAAVATWRSWAAGAVDSLLLLHLLPWQLPWIHLKYKLQLPAAVQDLQLNFYWHWDTLQSVTKYWRESFGKDKTQTNTAVFTSQTFYSKIHWRKVTKTARRRADSWAESKLHIRNESSGCVLSGGGVHRRNHHSPLPGH